MAMDLVLHEWLSMIIRWLHVVAGIAWIGGSFYFIHLDLSLKPRDGPHPGVQGEAWQVHGGGFYHMVKYLVAPQRMPDGLTWFKWEAYTTWLSGFALLVVVYYLGAELYLVDKAALDMPGWAAALLSSGGLLLAWLGYEVLCRSMLAGDDRLVAGIGYAALVLLTYLFTTLFSGRGAFVEIGALIGTMMVANVFVVIIPNQKKTVAALLAGEEPNPRWGREAKLRSVHNNYLTLPVVFLMIATHYPLLFATRYNWLIVAIVLALGPVIRHFFNSRHAGRGSPWWTWAAAAAGMAAIAWLSAAGPREATRTGAQAGPSRVAAVEEIVTARCAMCHAEEPAWPGIAVAPRGILLDSPARIRAHAAPIAVNAGRSHAMPPGNVTDMTADERAILAAWFAAGAQGE
ncbi:MAG: urate hydroxylase PuuD [Rhodospirillales bacterium]